MKRNKKLKRQREFTLITKGRFKGDYINKDGDRFTARVVKLREG